MRKRFPEHENLLPKFTDFKPFQFPASSVKLQRDLGVTYRPIEETFGELAEKCFALQKTALKN